MPLLLWAKSPVHSQTTLPDFIDWLRYRAIDFGMPPQFIDCVDALNGLTDAQDEIAGLKADVEIANDALDKIKLKFRMAKTLRKAKTRARR